MQESFCLSLWNNILRHLDSKLPNWRQRIIDGGQIRAIESREAGFRCADSQIFEGFVKAVLSSNTDWTKIERILPELTQIFRDFDLHYYSSLSAGDVENHVHIWFKDKNADSQTLKANLKYLVNAAQKLESFSKEHGSLEDLISHMMVENNNDPILLATQFGSYKSRFKLPGVGIPIAAEALKNIGFDVAKPDRHINRAVGCFNLIRFRKWYDGKKFIETDNPKPYAYPEPNETRCVEVMKVMKVFSSKLGVRTAFLDNAIWLLCSKGGVYMENKRLMEMAESCR